MPAFREHLGSQASISKPMVSAEGEKEKGRRGERRRSREKEKKRERRGMREGREKRGRREYPCKYFVRELIHVEMRERESTHVRIRAEG
jgi:hypothetical protein